MNPIHQKKTGRQIAGEVYIALLLIFIYVPVGVMIAFSFNNSRVNMVWSGFTLKYYRQLFQDGELWHIFGTTLLVAAIATALAVFIATLGAVGLRKAKFPGKKIIEQSVYFPIVLPEIVLGAALLLMFTAADFTLGMGTIIIGNTTLLLPYVFITVKARLVGMDPAIEEASLDLGADRAYTFMHITLPAIRPGVVSGAFMSFSLALDELIVTSFLTSADITTLPIKVYSMVKKGVTPEINALTTIIFFVCMAGVLIYLIRSEMTLRRLKKPQRSA
ncbi:MAG: ABC transporter permease [Pseudoramibacter sp.]